MSHSTAQVERNWCRFMVIASKSSCFFQKSKYSKYLEERVALNSFVITNVGAMNVMTQDMCDFQEKRCYSVMCLFVSPDDQEGMFRPKKKLTAVYF
jgi:hypothetical protein